jgi:YYY domain-containing protein
MGDVLAFWLAALVAAACALPIAATLFRRFPDAGAGLSFILGLVLASWLYFILRTLDVLPIGRGGFVFALAVLGAIGVATLRLDRRASATIRRTWPAAALTALLFSCLFFAFAAFRSYTSAIGGTEQPMDFLYLNAMLNSPDYPPGDPWLAGSRAAYYYFGYLQTALLTSVADVPASSGYNLGLAALFASSATAVASVAIALARWILPRADRRWVSVAGGFAVVLLLFASSLIGVFELAAAHGWGSDGLYDTFGLHHLETCGPDAAGECYSADETARTDAWYPTRFWFWWQATRVIDGTIAEFPFFSFLLGDLHPHVMAIPLVMLALALAMAAYRGRGPLSLGAHRANPSAGAVIALALGALAFQNTWDVITFSGLFVAAVYVRNLRHGTGMGAAAGIGKAPRPLGALAETGNYLWPIVLLAGLAYLPWLLVFDSQAGGIYPYVGTGTAPLEGLVQFGAPLAGAVLLLAWSLRSSRPADWITPLTYALWVPVLPLLLWAPLAAWHGDLGAGLEARGNGGWLTLGALGAMLWALSSGFVLLASRRRPAAISLAFAATGVLLLYGAELFLVKDVFFGGVPRLNTFFKLGYQAWLLLAVAGGVGGALAFARVRERYAEAWPAAGAFVVVVLLALVYPVLAVPNRTEGFAADSNIDGLAALQRNDPAEYALARWVGAEVPPGAVVVEAYGDDYGPAGRVSSRTGRPAPFGWYFHEIQWRGDTDANRARFQERQRLVDTVYAATSPEQLLDALHQLGAEYVVVGRVEKSRYAASGMPDFATVLDVAFEVGDVRVYRMPVREVLSTT